MQTYGVNFIGIYLLLYYSVWGIGYAGLRASSAEPGAIVAALGAALDRVGLRRHTPIDQLNSEAGPLLVAWVLAKATEPLRLPLTVTITPLLTRSLRSWGLVSASPPRPAAVAKMLLLIPGSAAVEFVVLGTLSLRRGQGGTASEG